MPLSFNKGHMISWLWLIMCLKHFYWKSWSPSGHEIRAKIMCHMTESWEVCNHKARQSRFLVSHQPLSQFWCSSHYLLLKWSSLELFIIISPGKTLETVLKIISYPSVMPKSTREIECLRIVQIRGHGTLREREHNNDGWGGRVLVDEGSDGKQGIYFVWPNHCNIKA